MLHCNNNWKAHEIATSNYPQWHKHYLRKKLVNKLDGQAQKRCKVEIEDEPSKSESENTDGLRPENKNVGMDKGEDKNDATSSLVPQCNKGSRMGIPRPRAWALTRTDPL
jgi:hypothetical protein